MLRSPKLLYLYLGRRGAMPRFVLDLARADSSEAIASVVAIAEDNELAGAFDEISNRVVKFRTFSHGAGAVLDLGRISRLRRELADVIVDTKTDAVVELMPHIWSPFLEDVPRSVGAVRMAILHDWRAHPGDASGLLNAWLVHSALRADRIITLSQSVAQEVERANASTRGRITPLFHPDFNYQRVPLHLARSLRVLFLGRLMAYKGLDLCVAAIARARAQGAAIELQVAGDGDISALRPALEKIDAKVVNRWLRHDEIAGLLADCDVVAATHREASQSGVIAAAFGVGRPVVVTPVGALAEQVSHEFTGLVARNVSVEAISDAFVRLANDRAFVERLASNVNENAPLRSMSAFSRALSRVASEIARG